MVIVRNIADEPQGNNGRLYATVLVKAAWELESKRGTTVGSYNGVCSMEAARIVLGRTRRRQVKRPEDSRRERRQSLWEY